MSAPSQRPSHHSAVSHHPAPQARPRGVTPDPRGCWMDHYERPALQGRLRRHFGPAEIDLKLAPGLIAGSMIVGPRALVEGIVDDRVVFTLHGSEIVPNLRKVKGMQIAHRLRIVDTAAPVTAAPPDA